MTVFSGVTAALLLLLAVLSAVATRVASLDRPVRLATYAAEALVGLVVLVDVGLLLRADPADRPDSMITHLGYGVACVGLIPLLAWRRPPIDDPEAEVEPSSLWVVVIALLAVAVCVVRLAQTR